MNVEQIYEQFLNSGLTSSRMKFSEEWLGRSKHYTSTFKSRKSRFSASTLLRLQHRVRQQLNNNTFDKTSLEKMDEIISSELSKFAE